MGHNPRKAKDVWESQEEYDGFIVKCLGNGMALTKALKLAASTKFFNKDGPVVKHGSVVDWTQWLLEHPGLMKKEQEAMKLSSDSYVDKMISMADRLSREENSMGIGAFKLASEIYKWVAETRNPSKYGPKATGVLEVGDNLAVLLAGIQGNRDFGQKKRLDAGTVTLE